MIHQSLKTLIRYACHGWRMRLNVDTRDQVQTNLPVVGGNPTNLSRERIPVGMSAVHAHSGPGHCCVLGRGCCMEKAGVVSLTCNLIR